VDPYHLPQGATFWGHFRVSREASVLHAVEELALVQALPAGWEIENIRLSDEGFPEWMSGWTLNRESYLDIRDDRIMWFFDLPDEQKPLDFVVKLNTVTKGEYVLPPTWLEAMYNHEYQAKKPGGRVTVTGR